MALPHRPILARSQGCEMTLLSKQPGTPSVHSPAFPRASRERACPPQGLGEVREPRTPAWPWAHALRLPAAAVYFLCDTGHCPLLTPPP